MTSYTASGVAGRSGRAGAPDASRRRAPGRAGRTARVLPGRAGTWRSTCGGTGSASRRSLARQRRRSSRSIPVSHHSVPRPPGRNSPSATRPSAASRRSASVVTAVPRPNRCATVAAVNGPCVRAYLATRSPSGSGTGSVNASGTPGGSATPSPSRSRPASSTATHRSCPATLTSISRRWAASSASHPGAEPGSAHRSSTSMADSGPSAREHVSHRLQVTAPPVRREALRVAFRLTRRCPGRAVLAHRPGRAARRAATSPAPAPGPGARPAARRPRT